jgi:hypothetical protein
MYALQLPPELVTRLYRLREEHQQGPIRRQVLKAVECYLDHTESALGLTSATDPPPQPEATAPDCPRSKRRDTK